jgi:hypothetical protein
MKRITLFLLSCALSSSLWAQQKAPAEYGSGLKVNLNDDGSKYFRLIAWTQFWLDVNTQNVNNEDRLTMTPSLRRSRLLFYAQLSDRFLILTHFGLNNLNPSGLDPTGQSSQAQLFLHDAWVEFKVFDQLYLGGGLHYWNGISRLNNQSTLNFLPLDNPRHAWSTIGTTDQFARHLGLYAKGKVGKFDYRVSWNAAMVNSLDGNVGILPTDSTASYVGRQVFGIDASNVFAGYFNYQFFDQESNKLPYFVGSYLGAKKILNVGAGFYSHPKGAVVLNENGENTSENVLLWAVDVFTELPFGAKNAAFTGYLSYQNNNYGTNYQLLGTSQEVFTGNVIYFQGGVLLPHKGDIAWQPYATVTQKSITNLDGSATDFGIGINSLITGHHAKLSLEYRSSGFVNADAKNRVLLQAVIFL